MSECPFEGMFFLELPFWVRHIPFWGVGEGGALEVLKNLYRPRVIFKILGPPCKWQCLLPCPHDPELQVLSFW